MRSFRDWAGTQDQPLNEAKPSLLRRAAGGTIGGLAKGVGGVLKLPGEVVSAAGEALGKVVRGEETGVDAWLGEKEKALEGIEKEVDLFLHRVQDRIREYEREVNRAHRELYLRPDIETQMVKDRDHLRKLLDFAQRTVSGKITPYIQALRTQLEIQKNRHRRGEIFREPSDFGPDPDPTQP